MGIGRTERRAGQAGGRLSAQLVSGRSKRKIDGFGIPFAARASALLVGRRLIPAPLVLLAARGREDFPGEVVAVLLAPEPTPAVLPHPWDLRAEDPVDRRIAVRDVHARDLVVAVVLARPADRRV